MMEKPPIIVDEDLQSFITESRELLDDIEPRLIGLGEKLEQNQTPDDETVNIIFRGFHTIKGTAAFYQLDSVVSVAHKAETLLEFFRTQKETINTSSTDVLCHACDVIESLFRNIETHGSESQKDDHVKSILHRLNGRIDQYKKRQTDDTITSANANALHEGPIHTATSKTGEAQPIPAKIGRNVRIFVVECRNRMDSMEAFGPGLYWTSGTVSQGIETLDVMKVGAQFLGFDHLNQRLTVAQDILKTCENADRLPNPDERQSLEEIGAALNELLHIIDLTGQDLLTESMIDTQSSILENTKETPASGVNDLFLIEAMQCMNALQEHLMRLKEDRSSRMLKNEIKKGFHLIRGSSGMANLADLEMIAEKAESCLESVMDRGIDLDDWDVKALWYIISEIKETLSGMEMGQRGNIFKKAVLLHILEHIASGRNEADKAREIYLSEMPIETTTSRTRPMIHEPARADVSDSQNAVEPEPDLPVRTSGPETHGWQEPIRIGERRHAERRDIRVNIEKLDELINLIGELVIAENMVVKNPDIMALELENFEKASAHLRKIIRDLQDVALAVRMVPIAGIFRKMIRLVHDLSTKSGKKVSLKIIGEDTEIDKTVAELVSDPLVHLVRNAIDHGIQKKSDRTDDTVDGRIILEARHDGGEILVIIRDNGRGLDTEKILNKAMERGIVRQGEDAMSRQEIYNLIFHPGFSTQDTVTDLSGRGVGMDVVKKNMEKIKGHIHVYSKPNQGTTFVLGIPLTLAIIDGMLVQVGEISYTIPLLSIRETVQANAGKMTTTMDDQEMINLRGNVIPVIRLDRIYGHEKESRNGDTGLIVVVEHQGELAGLMIDQIVGEQQTVIKGLSGYMHHVLGLSGCTILGDGQVSLILDVGGVIHKARTHGVMSQPMAI